MGRRGAGGRDERTAGPRLSLAPGARRGALITTAAGYQLRVEPGALDAETFAAGAEDGRRALAAGRPLEAADTLRQALGLWRGGAVADCAYDAFAQADIARLEELRLAAHEELMDAELALGRCPVAELERLVREHPLRERLRGQLMLALHRSGRQADALAVYRRGRETLIAELGLEPSPALRRLEQDILQHAPALTPAAPPASPLARADERALVGRAEERRALRDGLDAHRPRVVLLSGGAGIGKTRLVAEAAAEAQSAGATVLYGHADEGHPIPFRALVTALRRLPLDALAEFEPEQATLASVMPELRGRLTAGEGPELCLALSTVLGELARREPLLLVLDDLHWADRDTLLLVRHLVRSAPLAILGAFRDDEPDAGLAGLIAELHAERVLSHVAVRGLDLAATRALVGADAPELVDVLWEATGGNPFLIEELLRHRRADRLWVPDSVHALLERRLARLDGDAQDVLATAAVIGAEFRLAHLEAVVAGRRRRARRARTGTGGEARRGGRRGRHAVPVHAAAAARRAPRPAPAALGACGSSAGSPRCSAAPRKRRARALTAPGPTLARMFTSHPTPHRARSPDGTRPREPPHRRGSARPGTEVIDVRFAVIDQCPVPASLAPVLLRIKEHTGATLNSCDRSAAAEPVLRKFGKKSQRELYEGFRRGLPGFNPANPPGRSTHERRNDGVAYPGPAGAPLPYWCVGMDWSDAAAVIRAARAEGFTASITYPGNPREGHHVNFRKEPRLPFRSLRRGATGSAVVDLTRRLSYVHSRDDGQAVPRRQAPHVRRRDRGGIEALPGRAPPGRGRRLRPEHPPPAAGQRPLAQATRLSRDSAPQAR